ncbi:MAG TPA: SpoIVB peptidase S55 domain-containing protein [Candidatus Sulfopaludibacter sp.]|nr:SpoIVB peptidase S55 domain-containing protein [Candidatus Sulfopaludibacter sp.]
MARLFLAALVAFGIPLSTGAQTAFFPLKDIRAGMHGTGRTVFSGDRVEEFNVEILGVLDNFGPKESLILARLSGGPLEHTGVMEGMSGSPVYIDGKLVGAVAMAFPFAKDPIGAIRPIEDMVRPSAVAAATRPASSPNQRLALALASHDLTRLLAPRADASAASDRMIEIATPLSFGGFSRATLDAFAPQLRALGLEPRQAITTGSDLHDRMGNPADLHPGSMISVQLMAGDLSVGASGTVTYIDGSRIYAFGHRFLDIGATALPFARAEVITLLPNVNTSFKLATAKEWMGTMTQDRNTAITGELGKRADMVPVGVSVSRGSRPIENYQMQMVDDPLLSPLLIQMAVFSAIDSTERTIGASTLRLSGEIEFQNGPAPVKLNNMFAADNGAAMQVSLNTAIPVAYVMQSGFAALKLKRVALKIEAFDQKKQLTIDSVIASRREVRPGEKVQLNVLLTGENGAETTRQLEYQVPIGAEEGPLYFTVSDAGTANLSDFRQILTASPRTAGQLITTVNDLHPNTKAYVRVWRAEPAYQLEGADLPAPPASIALILDGSQATQAGITQQRNSKVAEMEIDGGDMVISGVKTVQVDVKQ